MEEIIEDIVKKIKDIASFVLSGAEPFYPMVSTIKNDRENLSIISPNFVEEEKDFIYSQMLVAASLDNPDAIIMVTDSMALRVDDESEWDGTNPAESPFAEPALMFLMVTPEGLRVMLSLYSIADDGSIKFTKDEIVSNMGGRLAGMVEAALVLGSEPVALDFEQRLYTFMESQGFSIIHADS